MRYPQVNILNDIFFKPLHAMGTKSRVDFVCESVDINDNNIFKTIYGFRQKSYTLFNRNLFNIGVITVEKVDNKKPKYQFSVLPLPKKFNNEVWLIIVYYNDFSTNKEGRLGILCNVRDDDEDHKDSLFFTIEEVNDLLRKYKLNPEYWQPDDMNKVHTLLVERKSSISNPLKAGKISRVRHAVGKQAHKVVKKVKRFMGKTVSLSKSKGTFTRIRVEPEKNAEEVRARIKERFGKGEPGKKQPPVLPTTPQTNWDKFLKQIKWESQQEKAVNQYQTLQRKI